MSRDLQQRVVRGIIFLNIKRVSIFKKVEKIYMSFDSLKKHVCLNLII